MQKRHRSAEPSPRQLRVGEEVRHALARILERTELRDPALAGVTLTVTEVRLSPDLRHAIAFVMPLAGHRAEETLDGLARSAAHLRGLVAREVSLRYAPTLAFRLDTSFDHATRISELLHRPEVQRDVARDGKGEGEGSDGDGA